jgi:antitoxin YefM
LFVVIQEGVVKMQTIYRLKADELDHQFLEALKTLFQNKDIEIVVTEIDETTYLLQSEANRKRLMEAISAVEDGENLVEFDPATYQ